MEVLHGSVMVYYSSTADNVRFKQEQVRSSLFIIEKSVCKLQEYTASTNSWALAPSMTKRRSFHASILYQANLSAMAFTALLFYLCCASGPTHCKQYKSCPIYLISMSSLLRCASLKRI